MLTMTLTATDVRVVVHCRAACRGHVDGLDPAALATSCCRTSSPTGTVPTSAITTIACTIDLVVIVVLVAVVVIVNSETGSGHSLLKKSCRFAKDLILTCVFAQTCSTVPRVPAILSIVDLTSLGSLISMSFIDPTKVWQKSAE